MSRPEQPGILCVTRSPLNLRNFHSVLSSARYEVVPVLTAHQAVAFCVNNAVAAVVLDSEFLTVDGWSAAQTFKGLRPDLPVLLFVEDHREVAIPPAVDAIAATGGAMLQVLQRLLADDNPA